MPNVAPLTSGDISNRTAAFAIVPLLKRHHEKMILEKFGQVFVLPTRSTTVAKFRRYDALPLATTALVEGVSPSGNVPTFTDYTATLAEYGQYIPFTGFMTDTHEDPLLQEFGALCLQQAAETVETIRWNKVKAGTNVGYSNGARSTVNTPISLSAQRTATAALLRQRGIYITDVVSSSPAFRTEPIEAAFVAVCHPDCSNDIRNLPGFIPVKQYTTPGWANEIGSVEDVRYVRSTLFTPFPGLSGTTGGAKGAMRAVAGDGVSADVYPIIYFSKDAYGIVPLKGTNALSLKVVNPKPASGDPLGQRGTIGWITAQTSLILNDLWLYRLEVAVTA